MCISIHIYIYYIHTYVRTYVRTYIHTYIHTYIYYVLYIAIMCKIHYAFYIIRESVCVYMYICMPECFKEPTCSGTARARLISETGKTSRIWHQNPTSAASLIGTKVMRASLEARRETLKSPYFGLHSFRACWVSGLRCYTAHGL